MVCRTGLHTNAVKKIWLTRHGESEYNLQGKIGGDSTLSARGEAYARALPAKLVERLMLLGEEVSVAVWTSTLKRTIQTARMLPFPKLRWKALDEIDAGICDGMTYKQIAQDHPSEYEARKADKLKYRYPSGESYMDVIQRLEPVITEVERERESVCIVSHQAVLRAMYGYFMGIAPEKIPTLEMPLHTLIELTPMPDGTMHEQRFPIDISQQLSVVLAQQAAKQQVIVPDIPRTLMPPPGMCPGVGGVEPASSGVSGLAYAAAAVGNGQAQAQAQGSAMVVGASDDGLLLYRCASTTTSISSSSSTADSSPAAPAAAAIADADAVAVPSGMSMVMEEAALTAALAASEGSSTNVAGFTGGH